MKNFLVYHGDWFDFQFADFALGDGKDTKYIREALLLPRFRVAETGETYRVINSWDENGLLFENTGREKGWRKFSLTEMVWIHCLRELRGFGFSLAVLKKIREELFYFDGIKGRHYNPVEFAFFVAKAMSKLDVVLIVDKQGNGNVCLNVDYENSQIIKPLPASYVLININNLYSEIVKNQELSKKNNPLFPLSEKEVGIPHSIAFGGASEVRITTKDNKINKVELKKSYQNPEEALKKVRELAKDGKRKRISLEMQDGKVIAIEEVEKT